MQILRTVFSFFLNKYKDPLCDIKELHVLLVYKGNEKKRINNYGNGYEKKGVVQAPNANTKENLYQFMKVFSKERI